MSDDIKTNVINMFNRHNSDLPQDTEEQIKYFAGFNYVKLKRDTNGKKFVESQLISYAQKCHYIVSVLRNVDGENLKSELVTLQNKTVDSKRFKIWKGRKHNEKDINE